MAENNFKSMRQSAMVGSKAQPSDAITSHYCCPVPGFNQLFTKATEFVCFIHSLNQRLFQPKAVGVVSDRRRPISKDLGSPNLLHNHVDYSELIPVIVDQVVHAFVVVPATLD